ncbi:TIM barrel protein [Neobacillus drentensis]|uniref:sugar phosphate isomerase/epimerase family protein n=1 Tax=Neobacillus drentensis TaxID=220684 RepID=UPI0030030B63
MKVKSIKSLWGMEGSLESQFELIASAGYDGIESPLPNMIEKFFGFPADEKQFRRLLEQYSLQYIAMVFTDGINHAQSFIDQVERAAEWAPIMINSHSARDSMTFEEQAEFFEQALAVEQKVGIPVGHETHRGRAMFTPWTTGALLREFPELKLTADFSHWVCVCESLLEDQKEHLEMAIKRTIHIHTRVGYAQGPQVPHPGAPEYSLELNSHEHWWKQIAEAHALAGTQLIFTPEFGPPPYMPRLPFTNQPVSDLWQVCLWMKKRLEQMVNESF